MQKQSVYKYKYEGNAFVSDYQDKDLAIYDFTLSDDDIKQIKKLTYDSLTFNIPQVNTNYNNSFNENYNITIQYAPITIYDMNMFMTGKHIEQQIATGQGYVVNNDGNVLQQIIQGDPQHPGDNVHDLIPYDSRQMVELKYDDSYTGTQVQPLAHTFSLQQQSINSLINELNYPLKHIPYTQNNRITIQSDGNAYQTSTNGEIDITKQVYWDTFNGKLRFNFNGIKEITVQQFDDIAIDSKAGYGDNIIFQGVHYGDLGHFPTPSQIQNGNLKLIKDFVGTYNYAYVPSKADTYNLNNNIIQSSEQCIYVKQLDVTQEYKAFDINNLYFANQLLGLMQNPQIIFDFLHEYSPQKYSRIVYPQTRGRNYYLKLYMADDDNKYLKNVCAEFYIDANNEQNRNVVLAKQFFLQLWREVYVISPDLQSNTVLYKPENIRYDKTLYFCNTINANGLDIEDENKQPTPYTFLNKLNVFAYYVNSVSFNNYVSLQNNYPLQYQLDQGFEVEALKDIRFILLDENGVVLPRLDDFKIFLQFNTNQDNTATQTTTNFNRVITDN